MSAARVEVLAGPGIVIRRGAVVVWVGPGASAGLVEFLATSARNLGPSPRGGRLLADHLSAVLRRHDPEPAVAFAALGPDGAGGATVLLHGPAQLYDGRSWHRPVAPAGWSEHAAAVGTSVVLVGPLGAAPDPSASHPLLDLETGAVPGGGFALVPASPRQPAPAPPVAPSPVAPGPVAPASVPPPVTGAPSAEPPTAILPTVGSEETTTMPEVDHDAPTGTLTPLRAGAVPMVAGSPASALPTAAGIDGPPGVVGLLPPPSLPTPDTPSGGRPALPVVSGVRCPAGHFNHPAVERCVRCLEAVDDRDRLVSGPRPSLGVLVVDDGTLWPLDHAYLLGGDPRRHPSVTGGTARALPLPGERVEPVHAELRCSDWTVTVTDRGSQGGTFVLVPGSESWERIAPHRARTLAPGTHVAVGDRVLTYVSPWPG